MRKSILILAVALAGCSATDNQTRGALEQAPVDSAEFRGNYQQIAGCAYSKFTNGTANVMQRNEFPERKETRLTMMGGSLKAWELILTEVGQKRTRVQLTSVQTIWGPDKLSTRNVIADLRSCEA